MVLLCGPSSQRLWDMGGWNSMSKKWRYYHRGDSKYISSKVVVV
jgi:hypothetical protein